MQHSIIFANPDGQTAAVGQEVVEFSPLSQGLISTVLSTVQRVDAIEQGTARYFAPRMFLATLSIMGFVVASANYDTAGTMAVGGYFVSLLIGAELRLQSAADSFCAFKFKDYNQTIQHFFFKDCAATTFVFMPLAYIFSIACFVSNDLHNALQPGNIHAYILGTVATLVTFSGLARSLQKKYCPPVAHPLRDRLTVVMAEYEHTRHSSLVGTYVIGYGPRPNSL